MIAENVECADSYLRKVRGLMLRRTFKDTALVFPFKKETVVRIHMLFVFFPIDLLFLNKSLQILDLATLKPFIGYRSSKVPVSFVIELPAGIIERADLKKGERIVLTYLPQSDHHRARPVL